MLVPSFTISQNDTSVTVVVNAPNARLQDTEVTVDGNLFIFSGVPYYLRLHMPHELCDSELPDSVDSFYHDNKYTFVCRKQTPGQFFTGLNSVDLLSNLGKKNVTMSQSLIEELPGETASGNNDADEKTAELSCDMSLLDIAKRPTYGFANKFHSHQNINEHLYDVLDLPNANEVPTEERRTLRISAESKKFDYEHYLMDKYMPQNDQELLAFQPPYLKDDVIMLNDVQNGELISLVSKMTLPILSEDELKQEQLNLLSLLLACAYNTRISCGDSTCVGRENERWNVTKLCPLLCWFDPPRSTFDCVATWARRCLVYPWVRNWDLCLLLVEDTVSMLRKGKECVLTVLLDVLDMFENSPDRKLLNQLYVKQMCLLANGTSLETFQQLATQLQQVKLEKNDVALYLTQLENIFEEDQASKNDSMCIVNSSVESDDVLLDKKYTHQVNVPAGIDSDDSSDDSEDSSDSDDSDSSSDEDSSDSSEDSSLADTDDSDLEELIGGLAGVEVNDEQAHALL